METIKWRAITIIFTEVDFEEHDAV